MQVLAASWRVGFAVSGKEAQLQEARYFIPTQFCTLTAFGRSYIEKVGQAKNLDFFTTKLIPISFCLPLVSILNWIIVE